MTLIKNHYMYVSITLKKLNVLVMNLCFIKCSLSKKRTKKKLHTQPTSFWIIVFKNHMVKIIFSKFDWNVMRLCNQIKTEYVFVINKTCDLNKRTYHLIYDNIYLSISITLINNTASNIITAIRPFPEINWIQH